jgi:hypothetical protein
MQHLHKTALVLLSSPGFGSKTKTIGLTFLSVRKVEYGGNCCDMLCFLFSLFLSPSPNDPDWTPHATNDPVQLWGAHTAPRSCTRGHTTQNKNNDPQYFRSTKNSIHSRFLRMKLRVCNVWHARASRIGGGTVSLICTSPPLPTQKSCIGV